MRNVWELGRMQGGKLIIIWRKERGWKELYSVTSFVCSACGPFVGGGGGGAGRGVNKHTSWQLDFCLFEAVSNKSRGIPEF